MTASKPSSVEFGLWQLINAIAQTVTLAPEFQRLWLSPHQEELILIAIEQGRGN